MEEEIFEQGLPQPDLTETLPGNPVVLTREEHSISRRNIDPDALKVMYRLIQHGYTAFLVGGGVRDLLLNKRPKDFDVSTDAKPEEVRGLFRNSRTIGRRFRLSHVFFGGNKIIEVSTFRALGAFDPEIDEPIVRSDNTYGTPETDAKRRDLTINGLFYDPSSYSVIDYVGGIADLREGIIRMIGDPVTRYHEDPVRMIRVLRHAARTGFKIEPATLDGITTCRDLLPQCPRARVHEEILKDLRGGHFSQVVALFKQTGLLQLLMPGLDSLLDDPDEERRARIEEILTRIDSATQAGISVSAPVLFMATHLDIFPEECIGDHHRTREVIHEVFEKIGVTRREREDMEQIMLTAFRLFSNRGAKNGRALLSKPHFDEALLLIELTAANEAGDDCVRFWRSLGGNHRHGNRAQRHGRRRPRPNRRPR